MAGPTQSERFPSPKKCWRLNKTWAIKVAGPMTEKITRREALKIGTTAAVSAAIAPHVSSSAHPDSRKPDDSLTTRAPADFAPSAMPESDICFLAARQMADLIRQKKLSAREVMQAHLKQVARVNPKVNAIVTLVPEDQLMAQALAADEALAKGAVTGPLHGLPVGVKDLHPTKGIRTTFGSPLHKDDIPKFDCLVVEREKKAGAIVIGKTNVPEWGLGSQTFNPVFGPTLNPYDLSKTCGGSTGGGSVALACGMVPLAAGSDMGGSLRNPPNFCNVVGCAFFLSVLAGFDRRSPISINQPGAQFGQPLGRDFKGVRVAMFRDMG